MTTVTVRPNGTVSSTNITIGGGAASNHVALSDNNDATYSSFGASNSALTLDLGTTTIPAGSTVKAIRASLRASDTTPDGIGIKCEILDSTAGGAVLDANTISVPFTTGTLYAPWTNVTLSQAKVDGLRLRLSYNGGGYFTPGVNVREAYLEIEYFAAPTVTVAAVTPDPYTTSSVVPLSCTPTLDSAGGPQTHIEWKIFTAAQYGAGGFNPTTSASFWSSGTLATSATSISSGPLANSTTYRAYCRVAQTVNGAQHWSAWNYDQFDLAVTTSEVSTVTFTPTNSTASVAVAVSRNTGTSAWEKVHVERSDDGGTTWLPVYGGTYALATGNSFAVTDHDAPNGSTIRYRARAIRYSSGVPIVGAWVQSSAGASWTSTLPWLKVPGNPTLNGTVDLRVIPTLTWGREVGRFAPANGGRTITVSSALRLTSGEGQFTIQVEDDTVAARVLTALAAPVVLLQGPPAWKRWGSRYITCGAVTEATLHPEHYLWRHTKYARYTTSFTEVAAPADTTGAL